jgi:intraflagellar transport protein 172
VGNLKTNKAATLYQTESCVVSTASSLDGNAIITGHLDGSINRFFFDDGISGATQGKFTVHPCTPTAIGWGESVVAVGNDRCIMFYDSDGKVMQEFDYSRDDDQQEFTVVEFSPSGQSVVIGSYNRYSPTIERDVNHVLTKNTYYLTSLSLSQQVPYF